MTDEEQVAITLTGGGLSFSGTTSFALAVEILSLLTSGEPDLSRGTHGGRHAGSRSSRRIDAMSPQQALEASGAKTNAEKIVTFAALVSRQTGKETVTSDDIKPMFRQAREPAPGNLTRDLSTAIQSGWLADAETSGEYYLVGKANDVLDIGFEGLKSGSGGGRQSGSRSRSPGSRRPKKALSVPEAFADAEVSPVVDGLIDYHKAKTKADKYLWAVNAARLLGVEAVDRAELIWLTDRLGDGISGNDLNGYFRRNEKTGRVNRNAQGKVRMTPQGVKYLEELTAEKAK